MASPTADLLLRTRVEALDTRGRFSDQQILEIGINPTVRQLCEEALIEQTTASLTTTPGVASYDFPATMGIVHWIERVVHESNKQPILYKDFSDLRFVGQGLPTHYAVWSKKIWFDPVPGSATVITIHAYTTSVTVVGGNQIGQDQLGYNADIEDAVVLGAAFRLSVVDRESGHATILFQRYREKLEALKAKRRPDRGNIDTLQDKSGMDSFFLFY